MLKLFVLALINDNDCTDSNNANNDDDDDLIMLILTIMVLDSTNTHTLHI